MARAQVRLVLQTRLLLSAQRYPLPSVHTGTLNTGPAIWPRLGRCMISLGPPKTRQLMRVSRYAIEHAACSSTTDVSYTSVRKAYKRKALQTHPGQYSVPLLTLHPYKNIAR